MSALRLRHADAARPFKVHRHRFKRRVLDASVRAPPMPPTQQRREADRLRKQQRRRDPDYAEAERVRKRRRRSDPKNHDAEAEANRLRMLERRRDPD